MTVASTKTPAQRAQSATAEVDAALSRPLVSFKFGSRLKGDALNFVVGGAGIGGAGIYLLHQLVEVGVNKQLAYTIMLAITLTANFLWNRLVTWRGQRKGSLAQQAGAYLITRATTIIGSWLVFEVLVSLLGMDYQTVNIGCMAISMVVNYITSKRIFGTAHANA